MVVALSRLTALYLHLIELLLSGLLPPQDSTPTHRTLARGIHLKMLL